MIVKYNNHILFFNRIRYDEEEKQSLNQTLYE